MIEDCKCSLEILLSGDKNYWCEGSPINDLTIQNCHFTGKRGMIIALPSFEACAEAPFYHSGIKVLGNTFETRTAMKLSKCRDVLFEGNTTGTGEPFENIYQDCAEITER